MSEDIRDVIQGLDLPDNMRVRLEHNTDTCRGSSKSVSVLRVNDKIVYKCFRCGVAGSFYVASHYFGKRTPMPDEDWLYQVRNSLDYSLANYPNDARAWVLKTGIDEAELKHYGIGYRHDLQCILFPVVGGYQRRTFDATGQRYLTTKTGEVDGLWFETERAIINPNVCVLTEDVLSAIKVGRYVTAYALLGANLRAPLLATLIQRHDTFVIWLDNDNSQVVQQQIKLANQLKLFGKVSVIKAVGDPKLQSDTLIVQILNAVLESNV